MIQNIFICILLAVLQTQAKGTHLATVTEFGDVLYHTVSKVIDGTEEDMSVEVGDRIREIDSKVTCSQCAVIEEIGLPLRLGKLQAILTSSAVIYNYVKKILTAADEDSRLTYEGFYRVAFKAHESDINYLRYMLTSVGDGMTNSVLDAVADTIECSISMLDRFSYVYTEIVSTGYALSLVNERLSVIDHAPDLKTEWVKSINQILDTFEKQRNACITNFPVYAEEDFSTITNGIDLFTTLQSRYSDKFVDVMYLPRDCVIYHMIEDPFLFKETDSNPVRIAAFSVRKTYEDDFPNDDQIAIAERELIEADACRKENTIIQILVSVQNLFKWHSRQLRLFIAVPTNRLSHESFFTSDDSPIKTSTLSFGDCGKYTVITYGPDTTTSPGETSVIEMVTEKMPTTTEVVTESDPGPKPASGTGFVENSLCSQILIVHLIMILFV